MIETISQKRQRLYFWLILTLGTILRVIKLGNQSFWYDEVYSVNLAARSLGTMMSHFRQAPPGSSILYHLLLHFWLYMSSSDTMIRFLSVLFGIAALWLVYKLGKYLLEPKHGLLCGLLIAISPFHIWYSQENRMYSLLILLSTASALLFLKFLHEEKKWPVVGWAVATVLAIYTHYHAVFILLFQMIFFLMYRSKYRSQWRSLCYALGTMAIMGLPMFFLLFPGGRFAMLRAGGSGGNPLQLFSVPYTFFAFSLGFSYGPSVAELHRSVSLVVLRPYLVQILSAALLFLVIFFLGLRSLWRDRERLLFVVLYLIVPIAGAFSVSLVWPQVSYNVRYVAAALPAYVIIIAQGLLASRNKVIRWGLMVFVLAVTFVSIHKHYCEEKYAKEDYRLAVQLVSEHSEDSDVVLVTHLEPFEYYYQGPLEIHSLFWSSTFYQQLNLVRDRGFRRVWLVMTREWGANPEGEIQDYMRKVFPAMAETTFSNLYLGLFELTPYGGK